MPHHRIHLLPSLLAVLLVLSALAASAEIVIYTGDEDVPLAGALPVDSAGHIGVNSSLALDIPGAGGGVPLNVRAEILDTRMTEILSAGLAGPIIIGDVRGKPTLWVGEYRLVTVYPEDAAAKGVSMLDLAASWAETVQATILKCSNPLGPGADEVAGGVPQG